MVALEFSIKGVTGFDVVASSVVDLRVVTERVVGPGWVTNGVVYLRVPAVVTTDFEVMTDDISRLLVVTRGVVGFEVVYRGVVSLRENVVVSEPFPTI